GDIVSVLCGAVVGLLALSAFGDLRNLLKGRFVSAFEKVGRRTIISLCVQIVLLPVVAYFTIPILNHWVRGGIALSTWLLFATIVFNWDRLAAHFRRRQPVPDSALATASA